MYEYIEAEESLISCLMTRGDSVEDIYGSLTPEMFESSTLGKAFSEYVTAFDEKRELTLEELSQRMAAAGFEDYEINDALTRCAMKSAMSFQIKSYASVIQNHYKKRQIDRILGSTEIKDGEVDEQIEKLISDLDGLRGSKTSKGHTVAEITKEFENDYFCDKEKKLILLGDEIDNLTGGFQGGDLVAVGARPATGKSALAMQWAWRFAEQGYKVGYYNCEMQNQALLERFIASKSGIPVTRVRLAKAFLNDEEARYRKAIEILTRQDKIVIHSGAVQVSDIRRDAKEMHYDVIIVDYLQLLIPSNRYQGNRTAEVGQISRDLKNVAMDLDNVVIALTQLNRASEARQDKEPSMSEIRESGSIEQDASIVFLLWNKDAEDRTQKGFKTEKSRSGVCARYDLIFDGATMSFRSEREVTPFD